MQVTFFVSTATQGGGQETTIMTAVTQAVHHGMIYVPIGYTAGPQQFTLDAAQGGSPWGAGTFAGAFPRPPSPADSPSNPRQYDYETGVSGGTLTTPSRFEQMHYSLPAPPRSRRIVMKTTEPLRT